jgi:hypothetical protein
MLRIAMSGDPRSAQGCHPCLRYDLLPTSPVWTKTKIVRTAGLHRTVCRHGFADSVVGNPKKRFFAKAFPEPDLKYRSTLRAVTSSATATYERRTNGRNLLVETTCPC